MDKKIILGIDPGTNIMGFGLINCRTSKIKLIQYGIISLKKESNHLIKLKKIFEKITDALERGNRVELRGFGVFSTKQRDARVGRNPKTGKPVQIDAKTFPFFKVGKELHGLINDTQKTPEKECD